MGVGVDKSRTAGLSLFHRILAAFLGVVVILAALLITIFYTSSKRSLLDHAEETIFQHFTAIQYQFNDELAEELTRDLNLLAVNPILDEFMMSTERESIVVARKVERLFQQFMKEMDPYQRISFVDYLGNQKVIFEKTGAIRTYNNISGGALFAKLQAGAPGSMHFEDPLTDEKGNWIFSIGINKADPDIGAFGGAIIIDYNLQEYIRYLDSLTIFGENPVWMFSHDGNVLKQPASGGAAWYPREFPPEIPHDKPNLFKSSEGILIYQDMFVVPGEPLARMAISIPSSILFKDIRSTFKFFILAFMVSLIPVLAIAFYLSKYLTEPIVRLTHAASRLAKGDLSTKVDVQTTGEVQVLVENFNTMAEDLEKTTVSKEYVDNIIGSLSEALIVTSTEGKILRSNETATELTGLTEEEMMGRGIESLIEGNGTGKEHSLLEDITSGRSVRKVEKSLVTRSGERVPIIFSSSVMRDQTGTIQGIVCVAQDITELRGALKQIQALTGLLPICSVCKKIRDEEGQWKQMEAYLSKHSEANFSHSYCTECAEEMLSEIHRDK